MSDRESEPELADRARRLRAAFDAGDDAAIRDAALEVERRLRRPPHTPSSLQERDRVLREQLTGASPDGVAALHIEALLTGWALQHDGLRPSSYEALTGRTWNAAVALRRLAVDLPAALARGEEALDHRLAVLEHAGRIENLRRVPVWDQEDVERALSAEPVELCHQLARRRVMFAAEKLTRLPETLEGKLAEKGAFEALRRNQGEALPLLAHLLDRYGYLEREAPWRRLGRAARSGLRRVLRATAGERWAYEWTQGAGQVATQWALIVFTAVVVLLGLVAVTQWHAERRASLEADLRWADERLDEGVRSLQREAADARRRWQQERTIR